MPEVGELIVSSEREEGATRRIIYASNTILHKHLWRIYDQAYGADQDGVL